MKKFFNLFKAGILSWALVMLTTFGWNPFIETPVVFAGQLSDSQERLQQTVEMLAVTIGVRDYEHYERLNQAANYIQKQLSALGYEMSDQKYVVGGREFRNIIAKSGPQDSSFPVLIVGAHYDSCDNPGADDNASGVAALIELARQLKDVKAKTPIWFVAFTNEEPPFFTTPDMGSRVFTKDLKARKQEVKAAVILEMLGYYSSGRNSQRYLPLMGMFYPNKGNFIAVVSNFSSRKIKNKLVKEFRKATDFPIEGVAAPETVPGIYFSDHWSFWQEKYPAIMITDTAYLRNPHYHKPTDLPETLNYQSMASVVHGLKRAIEVMISE